jgi:hypothetical protein
VRLPGEQLFVQSVRKAADEMSFYEVDRYEDGRDTFEELLSIEGEVGG